MVSPGRYRHNGPQTARPATELIQPALPGDRHIRTGVSARLARSGNEMAHGPMSIVQPDVDLAVTVGDSSGPDPGFAGTALVPIPGAHLRAGLALPAVLLNRAEALCEEDGFVGWEVGEQRCCVPCW